MFVLDENEEKKSTFIRKVHFQEPHGKAFKSWEFDAEFLVIDQAELDEIFDNEEDLNPDDTLLRKVLIGWGDSVVDTNKKPIKFDAAIRDKLIQKIWARVPLVKKYIDTVAGGKAGKRKRGNS
ncbi:MAG TPA: hypothetical protein ENI80_03570 [Acidiferrobacteraceae bacterium]|nr:hypothetical protein [Acidiferrobacteraceae bacterium]